MLPRLRLKTKLVLAISGMVVAVVATLSFVYVSRLVQNRMEEAFETGDFVAHQVFHATRQALEIDLSNVRLKTNDPAEVDAVVENALQTDAGIKSLIESIVGYSPNIYDVAITDTNGRALLHSDARAIGATVPRREQFQKIREGGLLRQLRLVYGRPGVYEVPIALERDGKPFGTIRVGLSTVFLKSELQPQMNRALLFSGTSIFLSLILAAIVSNIALHPLESIARRLDLLSAGQIAVPDTKAGNDEVGVVTTKIDRLGQQMRDVQEVFSALKENLDQIMANLQDGLMLFTRDHRAVLVSASVESFVGRPRSEMLAHTVREIFDDSTDLGRLILTSFELHHPLDLREVQLGGRRVQVSLDFIEERGQPIGAMLTMRDAESVHRIEDEIELSRRLAAIGRLTSGVAHEVKNPINAIVVHLEVLRQKLKDVDPDTRRHMEIINSEIRRLDRVVQTLVDFTRPVELRLAEIDLRRVVEEVVLLASPEAERHGIRIVHHTAPSPLPVNVDADLIKQAALNIALNGVQAMSAGETPRGGTLTITTAAEGDEAVVTIADEGPGIAPEVRDKIFNLYFTTKKTGTGIGLSMAYRVLQLHNGAIDLDAHSSTHGATFHLRLPLQERTTGQDATVDVRNQGNDQKEVAAQGS
ncbi:MAG: PAS domain-containing sensor histidine kinase [Candidatus Koribacter versatilis]|uniref:histidine kinase n=1 Tax=Candidatus Korobacter versatilis TaxID=658062 RepID=A0A932ER55_9BACT|nr:PAS domain-containing sensor histidine kinase [Candidatus Koribacter versatilis]